MTTAHEHLRRVLDWVDGALSPEARRAWEEAEAFLRTNSPAGSWTMEECNRAQEYCMKNRVGFFGRTYLSILLEVLALRDKEIAELKELNSHLERVVKPKEPAVDSTPMWMLAEDGKECISLMRDGRWEIGGRFVSPLQAAQALGCLIAYKAGQISALQVDATALHRRLVEVESQLTNMTSNRDQLRAHLIARREDLSGMIAELEKELTAAIDKLAACEKSADFHSQQYQRICRERDDARAELHTLKRQKADQASDGNIVLKKMQSLGWRATEVRTRSVQLSCDHHCDPLRALAGLLRMIEK